MLKTGAPAGDAFCHSSVQCGPETDTCKGNPFRVRLGSVAGALCKLATVEVQSQGRLIATPCQGIAGRAAYLEHEVWDDLQGQQAQSKQ